MEKAYVLLNVDLDSKREVLDSLKEIPEIKEACQLYGVYDFIIRIEAETLQELKDLVEHRVKGIEKVRSTMQLICIKGSDTLAN